MSKGKHLSLEEARKVGQIDQFCMEHPSEGDSEQFASLLEALARKRPATDQTSDRAASAYCSDTQTPSRTSEGASGKREEGVQNSVSRG